MYTDVYKKKYNQISGIILALFITTNLYKIYLPNVFGVDLTLLLAVFCCFVIMLDLYFFKDIKSKYLIFAWSMVCFFYLFSYLYTPSISYSRQKLIEILVFNTLIICTSIIVFNSEEGIKYFHKIIVAFGLVLLSSLIFSYNISNINGLIYVLRLNYLVYSRHLLLVSIICMAKYLAISNLKMKAVYILLSMLCFYGILISGARSTAIFLVLILLVFFNYNFKKTHSFYMIIIFLFIAGFLVGTSNLNVGEVAIERIKTIDKNNDTYSRANYLKVSFDIFKDKPFFGGGVGSYPIYFNNIDEEDYPHNIIMEVIDETGLVGFSAFFFMLILVIIKVKNRLEIYRKKKEYEMSFYEISLLLYIVMMVLFSSIGSARVMYSSITILYCGGISSSKNSNYLKHKN